MTSEELLEIYAELAGRINNINTWYYINKLFTEIDRQNAENEKLRHEIADHDEAGW